MIFDPNHPVSGALFRGRESEIAFFKRNLIQPILRGRSVNISVTGMNRIGKTSLMREVCRRFREIHPPEVFIIEADMERYGSFWSFWIDGVLLPLRKMVHMECVEEDLWQDIDECFRHFEHQERRGILYSGTDKVEDQIAKRKLEELFELLTIDDKSILLVIDEFDKAGKLFGNMETNFGWFRSFLQEREGLSVVTISRRSIYCIETNCFGGSTLAGIFTDRGIFGFTNQEIDGCVRDLEALCGRTLTAEEKEQIWYNCGRSPYYLAMVGQAFENAEPSKIPSIPTVAHSFCSSFARIVRLLKEEKLLKAMLQMFVGPTYNLRQSDVDRLMGMGYCIDWTQLVDYHIDYLDYITKDEPAHYLTICQRLVDYLEETHKAELDDIWPELRRTVEALRNVIEVELRFKYGDTWKEKLESYLSENSVEYRGKSLRSHDKLYNKASEESRNEVGNSALNVISVKELGLIITASWDSLYKDYFWESKSSFCNGISCLHSARNPIAHLNGKLLTPAEIAKVEEVCKRFLKSINSKLGIE